MGQQPSLQPGIVGPLIPVCQSQPSLPSSILTVDSLPVSVPYALAVRQLYGHDSLQHDIQVLRRWKGGNGPEQTDSIATGNLIRATPKGVKRFVLVTSAGVERFNKLPFSILNLFGKPCWLTEVALQNIGISCFSISLKRCLPLYQYLSHSGVEHMLKNLKLHMHRYFSRTPCPSCMYHHVLTRAF